jgi:hypothetical protein
MAAADLMQFRLEETFFRVLSLLSRRYLYVRMLCNPTLYGVPIDAADTDPLLEVGDWVTFKGRLIISVGRGHRAASLAICSYC